MEDTDKTYQIIITGGGTGGHIFPAIAIANAIRKVLLDKAKILFVGANGRMEMTKVPAAGYEIVGLPIQGFVRKLSFRNFKVLFNLAISLYKARQIVRKYNPSLVIGVGGYASGPMVRIAARAGVPCLIQEQNSYAGITNKLLAKEVNKICVAYPSMERFFPKEKILLTGNPVREDLLKADVDKAEAYRFFELDPKRKTLLVLGGSLGARTINHTMINDYQMWVESDYQVLWQTGELYYNEAIASVQAKGSAGNVRIVDFIYKMEYAYAIADVVVTRAGAGTISELSLLGKAVIFVPSPNVAEDHQTKNAKALTSEGAALLVPDSQAGKQLTKLAQELLADLPQQVRLQKNIKLLAISNAAERIAFEALDMIKMKEYTKKNVRKA